MKSVFVKQKTAYERRISDWSSDVCSSDLPGRPDCGCPGRAVACLPVAWIVGVPVAPPHVASSALHSWDGVVVDVRVWVRLSGLRSEERRVWIECVISCIFRFLPFH